MNMALKAQSQSRATIQALTELKYPKQATFVKQANIAGGNQQVNNITNSDEASRVNEIENAQNGAAMGTKNIVHW
jgi:PDZ domain-containing secreted protein